MENEVDVTSAEAGSEEKGTSSTQKREDLQAVAGTPPSSPRMAGTGGDIAKPATDVQSRDAAEGKRFDNDVETYSIGPDDKDLSDLMDSLKLEDSSVANPDGKGSEAQQGGRSGDTGQQVNHAVAVTPSSDAAPPEHINTTAVAEAGLSGNTTAGIDGAESALEDGAREPLGASPLGDDQNDYDLTEDDELAALIDGLELKDAQMKDLAARRLRIIQPVAGEENKWRLISPGQFENENGRWPTQADYDSHPVLLDDDGVYRTKSHYYSTMLAGSNTREQKAAATAEFNTKMDEFGMSHSPFGASQPDANLLITHKNGQQTLERRDPDVLLSAVLETHGRTNVALRCEDGAYRTVDTIALDRQSNPYKLSYGADQLYKSYVAKDHSELKAFGRSNNDTWIAVTPDGNSAAAAGRTQLLVVNPATKSLLSPASVGQIIKKRPGTFDGKDFVGVMQNAGVDPQHLNSPDNPVPDILVRIGPKTLLAGEKLAVLAAKGPLTEQFLKKDIYLQNYGTRYDEQGRSYRGPTGNFSSLESREVHVKQKFNNRLPAEQYARVIHSLEPSQQQQLNLPDPHWTFEHLRTNPAGRELSTQAASRSRTQLSGHRDTTPINDVNTLPEPSAARQMSRAPRSAGRAG